MAHFGPRRRNASLKATNKRIVAQVEVTEGLCLDQGLPGSN